jgi:diacylglycerol kinase (ATP)
VVAVLLVAKPSKASKAPQRPSLGDAPPVDTGRRPALPPYPRRKGLGPLATFAHAWNGLLHTVVHQRNMRIHLVAGVLVGLVGAGIPLGLAEKVTLIFCVLLIFFAEILNSALEQLVDLIIQQYDDKARLAKDAAAAAVLLLAGGTVVIFAAVLVHNWDTVSSRVPQIARQVALGVPLTACHAGLLLARRKPLALDLLLFGGATGLWLATVTRTESPVFSALTYLLVVVAAASALERRRLLRQSQATEGGPAASASESARG